MDNKSLIKTEYIQQIQENTNLPNIVHNAIKEAIVNGKFSPGMKLKQVELANQLGVSQQTVREALKQLAFSGWVIQKPNRGFTVSEISLKEQDEIMEIRAVLEVYAFTKAIDILTETDLLRMRQLLPMTNFVSYVKPADANVINFNFEFHMIPVKALNNTNLTRMLENIWSRLWIYHFRNESDEKFKNAALHDFEEHKRILNALEKRDAEEIRKSIMDHYRSTKEVFHILQEIKKVDKR